MNYFNYQQQELYAEDCSVAEIARRFGTPCYIYSRATLDNRWQAFANALKNHPGQVCYAVKANSNLAILNILARLGAGFDIVSVGELERVLVAGGNPHQVVFSGVAKKEEEMKRALEVGIQCFNIESLAEIDRLQQIALEQNMKAPIALRVNPDISTNTHPYIATGLKENKFGVNFTEALAFYQYAATLPNIRIIGIACHIGSQITESEPFRTALKKLLHLCDQLQRLGITISHIDIGGGLGVRYQTEQPLSVNHYLNALLQEIGDRPQTLIFAPGRAIVAEAGILVTKVEFIKTTPDKNFAIVDGGMNDLIRPALYEAWHDIKPLNLNSTSVKRSYDIVGPVCETGDFLAKDREMHIDAGDLLAVMTAGAYGFSMSSNYNSRPRAAEVMVDGKNCYLIRERELIADLFKGEKLLPI